MTTHEGLFTFMDCPDRTIHPIYTCKNYGGVPCKQLCKDKLCPRGFQR